MSDLPILEHQDRDVRAKSLEAMAQEIDLLDRILLHLNHGTAALSGSKTDRRLNFLCMLLINRATNSLWRARVDAVEGYHVQSLTLTRSALEDWGTTLYAERKSEKVGAWLGEVIKELETTTGPPQFKQIWAEIGGELGEQAAEMYSQLSLIAHPRGGGLSLLFHFDRETTYFHVGGQYVKPYLEGCLYFALAIGQMFLERAAQLQHRALGSVDREWVSKGSILTKEAEAFLAGVHQRLRTSAEPHPASSGSN